METLVNVPSCPGCGAGSARSYGFPEGRIYLCTHCRLQWADQSEAVAPGDLNVSLVNDRYMDPASLGEHYPPFEDFLARLEALKAGPLRILDVGCGNGRFIAAALARNHDARGIEIDTAMAALMPEAVRRRVAFQPVETVDEFGPPIDVVTFWDSFEHLVDPLSVLATLSGHLAEDALVFLRVNNVHDVFNIATRAALVVAPPLGRRLLRMCFNLPHHYWNFSGRAMCAMVGRAGWRVFDTRITETPIFRLTTNPIARLLIGAGYLANRLIGGGKIGEYWLTFAAGDAPGATD